MLCEETLFGIYLDSHSACQSKRKATLHAVHKLAKVTLAVCTLSRLKIMYWIIFSKLLLPSQDTVSCCAPLPRVFYRQKTTHIVTI